MLLAALLVGLSRLASRHEKPAVGGGDPVLGKQPLEASPPADQMSGAPPDLTFYRTLGKERPAPSGGGPAGDGMNGINNNDEAHERPPGLAGPGTGAYVVQALATREAPPARRVRDRLATRGFPATVTEDRSGGQPVYRVRVGRYRTRAEAEAAVRVLRQKLRLSPWILQEGE